MERIGCVNGEFRPESELRISALDRGFLLGDGVFESLRVFSGRPAFARAHFERLAAGADAVGIALPWDADGFAALVAETARRNGPGDWVVRVTLSRGVGGAGYDLPDPPPTPTAAATVRPAPDLARLRRAGISCAASALPRPAPIAPGVPKTTSLAGMVQARRAARARGAVEAVFFDSGNRLLEGAAASVFVVAPSGAIATPPLARGILAGTTRALLLGAGLGVERDVARAEVDAAAALILCAASTGPVPASSWEDRPLDLVAPAARAAAEIFDAAVASNADADAKS